MFEFMGNLRLHKILLAIHVFNWLICTTQALSHVASPKAASSRSTAASSFRWVRPVYIRSVGSFLPNDPVPNGEIEQHLGGVHSKRSALMRRKILSLNGIKNRYYAMVDGEPTHLNVDIAAEAVHDALTKSEGVALDDVGKLATGTSIPDVIAPGFANLLHGKIGGHESMDCLSSAGVCISSTNALKAAAHSVTLGEHNRALVVGSEASSHLGKAQIVNKVGTGGKCGMDPKEAFKAEFLRYMLSDGAGCALLDVEPHPTKLSFRVERFYHHSFAHELPPCMVFGTRSPGKPIELHDIFKFNDNQFLLMQQDIALLNEHVIPLFQKSLLRAIDDGILGDEDQPVDWFFPHISSHFFYEDTVNVAEEVLGLPKERIWTNLSSVGNVGAASMLLLLWGALNPMSDGEGPPIKKGDRVMMGIPESGNFSYHYILLTVVDKDG